MGIPNFNNLFSALTRLIGGLFAAGALAALTSCSGQLYRVAAVPQSDAPPLISSGEDLAWTARRLIGDELINQFDANLLLAGVVVADVRALNRGRDDRSLALQIQTVDGKAFMPLPPKKALQKVMDYYGNRLYAQAAYQQTLARYESLSLPLAFSLRPAEEKRGFLFFAKPQKAGQPETVRIVVEGSQTAVNIDLK